MLVFYPHFSPYASGVAITFKQLPAEEVKGVEALIKDKEEKALEPPQPEMLRFYVTLILLCFCLFRLAAIDDGTQGLCFCCFSIFGRSKHVLLLVFFDFMCFFLFFVSLYIFYGSCKVCFLLFCFFCVFVFYRSIIKRTIF